MAALPISYLLGTPSIKIIDEQTKSVRWSKLKTRSVEIGLESDNAALPLSNVQVSNNAVYTKLLEADLQTGKIIRPSHLKLSFWSPDVSTTESIIQAFYDQKSTFQVTSKSIISDSMIMLTLDIEQSPDALSATSLSIEFEQATPPGAVSDYDPAQQADQPTRGVRIQSPVSLTQSVSDLYTKILKTIGA